VQSGEPHYAAAEDFAEKSVSSCFYSQVHFKKSPMTPREPALPFHAARGYCDPMSMPRWRNW
jgi:hypothetical protein